jgi:hypothetical protein
LLIEKEIFDEEEFLKMVVRKLDRETMKQRRRVE